MAEENKAHEGIDSFREQQRRIDKVMNKRVPGWPGMFYCPSCNGEGCKDCKQTGYMETRYKTKSKSKTFMKETGFQELHDYFCANVETEERDIPAEPSTFTPPQSETVTKHKYIVTITKIEEWNQ